MVFFTSFPIIVGEVFYTWKKTNLVRNLTSIFVYVDYENVYVDYENVYVDYENYFIIFVLEFIPLCRLCRC